ncbi:hypothetical protein SKAU_G00148960 [Synaphobranchus kaupii]|uniref:Uncharacterized protein n=1 Tax=Synaphobranchus kaupii TaxID=118154 RepID=A0A9Q1J559_SYNKA|nr:hypothetical protein SKAU_G00148960 [Synaphobranchus kaupii]
MKSGCSGSGFGFPEKKTIDRDRICMTFKYRWKTESGASDHNTPEHPGKKRSLKTFLEISCQSCSLQKNF